MKFHKSFNMNLYKTFNLKFLQNLQYEVLWLPQRRPSEPPVLNKPGWRVQRYCADLFGSVGLETQAISFFFTQLSFVY